MAECEFCDDTGRLALHFDGTVEPEGQYVIRTPDERDKIWVERQYATRPALITWPRFMNCDRCKQKEAA